MQKVLDTWKYYTEVVIPVREWNAKYLVLYLNVKKVPGQSSGKQLFGEREKSECRSSSGTYGDGGSSGGVFGREKSNCSSWSL